MIREVYLDFVVWRLGVGISEIMVRWLMPLFVETRC